MMPVLQAEESVLAAQRAVVGRCLKPEMAEDLLDQWQVRANHGDSPRRPKAPPIPRDLLPTIGMGYVDEPPAPPEAPTDGE